ncbi:MAG TPA: hypothetical protein PKD20_05450 [Candidatus Saccharibacteria bacterium]|jgi:hypothetical protein|nr:hypothetical protein [Candidatus Saccharibacteria bacterium]HMT56288.1 hypothetical protein [Candidatus Saccharibacteria bacterium]
MGVEIQVSPYGSSLPPGIWADDDPLLTAILLKGGTGGFDKWARASLSVEEARRTTALGQLSMFDLENPVFYL